MPCISDQINHDFIYVDRTSVRDQDEYPYIKYRYECSHCGERKIKEVTMPIGAVEI